jgi:CRP-like cAMP-binding protein
VAKLKINTVKRAILEYLLRKPEREYPLMEIVEWWMEEQRAKVQKVIQQYIDHEIAEINRTLNELKKEGLIEEVASSRGINYRIIPDKLSSIITYIE